MNSKLLDTIGLSNVDPAIYVIILLVIGLASIAYCIVLTVKNRKMSLRYEKFMKDKDGKSLEEEFSKRFNEIDKLMVENSKKTKAIEAINDNLKNTIQKCGIVKYDAFNEMGGKLSFALVLLDKENNGFVINAMHSREGCYTYIKEIINGESFVLLGDEEQQALNKALGKE